MSNSSFKRHERRRSVSMRPLLFAVLFVLAASAALLWRTPFQGWLWQALAPLQAARAASVTDMFGALSSKLSLAQENARLQAQTAGLQARVADRDELYRENMALKQELGRLGAAASSTVLAGVLSLPPAVPYDTLVIDAGIKQGIAGGDLVAAAGGAYIGEIHDVSNTASRVELFSSPGVTRQGLLNGSVPVTIEGDGGGALSAHVPAETPAQAGDTVVLPGIAGGVFATVASVQASAENSFKTLYLQLPANTTQLQFVEVHRTAVQPVL